MKAKQKNLRIFEIEVVSDDAFFAYMDKNEILLKDFFLLLKGNISDAVTAYLDEHRFCYKLASECPIKIPSRERSGEKDAIIETNKPQREAPNRTQIVKERVKTLLIEQPVRSGVEISHAGDVTIFGRVNSAAKVFAEGNVEIYGVIDGVIECDGDYMIVKDLGKGHIIFRGDILDRDLFDGKVKKITSGKEGVVVKDLFETAHY